MQCKFCGTVNSDDAVYCKNCGKRLDGKKNCPACGTVIDVDSVYCNACGTRVDGK
ncbi:MAG: zinc ribbon domain-containing protein, partial [Clostridia bacterium]|nr:zinc ribbon domain-containing protein [Clostridia bacterium]